MCVYLYKHMCEMQSVKTVLHIIVIPATEKGGMSVLT